MINYRYQVLYQVLLLFSFFFFSFFALFLIKVLDDFLTPKVAMKRKWLRCGQISKKELENSLSMNILLSFKIEEVFAIVFSLLFISLSLFQILLWMDYPSSPFFSG